MAAAKVKQTKDKEIKAMVDKKLEDKMNIHFMADDIQEG